MDKGELALYVVKEDSGFYFLQLCAFSRFLGPPLLSQLLIILTISAILTMLVGPQVLSDIRSFPSINWRLFPFFKLAWQKKEERDKKIVAVLYGALFNNNTAIDLFIAFEWYI